MVVQDSRKSTTATLADPECISVQGNSQLPCCSGQFFHLFWYSPNTCDHKCCSGCKIPGIRTPKKQIRSTYNFVFLLSVEGSGPLSLGRRRSFGLGLGLGPACRTLVGGTPRFRMTEEEEAVQGKDGTVSETNCTQNSV